MEKDNLSHTVLTRSLNDIKTEFFNAADNTISGAIPSEIGQLGLLRKYKGWDAVCNGPTCEQI